jgi:hypothetical protein
MALNAARSADHYSTAPDIDRIVLAWSPLCADCVL